MSRQSIVNQVRVISVVFSSVVKVGDSTSISPVANIFALQRRKANFASDEGDELEKYQIYKRKVEMPMIQNDHDVVLERESFTAPLRVDRMDITGLSTSAVLQIGNTHEVIAESRIKHIRDFT